MSETKKRKFHTPEYKAKVALEALASRYRLNGGMLSVRSLVASGLGGRYQLTQALLGRIQGAFEPVIGTFKGD